jgi:hypothetical protein
MTSNNVNEIRWRNPFTVADADRHAIWEILVRGDFEAFVTGDWSLVESDFWVEGFCGIDARKEPEPSNWKLTFPDIKSYRDEWSRQVSEFASVSLIGTDMRQFLYESCCLKDIEIRGERALARKTFDGMAETIEGKKIVLRFQTLYQLIHRGNRWLIAGFVGYLPNPMPQNSSAHRAETPW